MSIFLLLGLGIATLEPVLPPLEHRTRIEHSEGVVEAKYRTQVALVSRQIGSPANGGTRSTLRCMWRADISVAREARLGTNVRLTRGIDRTGVVEGSRPGWCSTHRKAIAQEVAARADEIRTHVVTVAREDETVLKAELARVDASREG